MNEQMLRDLFIGDTLGYTVYRVTRRGQYDFLLTQGDKPLASGDERRIMDYVRRSCPVREVINPDTGELLINDCGCITHTGPHWLHMMTFDKQARRKMLQEGNFRALAVQGKVDMQNAAYSMQSAGMNKTETIWEFLARTGWPQWVIDICREEYMQ